MKWKQEWENKEQKFVLMSVMAARQWHVLGPEQVVHLLQLLLGQHKTVDLFLSWVAWNGNTSYKQCSSLLLFLGLGNTLYINIIYNYWRIGKLETQFNFTFTKDETGKVAKSEVALAPGWYETTCSATSPWKTNMPIFSLVDEFLAL